MHHGHARERAGVGEEEARREVVGGVDDHRRARDERRRGARQRAAAVELDRRGGEAAAERVGEGVELGAADVGVGEEDLPVQVGELDPIVVGDADRGHAGRRERERRGRADAAGADEHDQPVGRAHRKYSSRLK